jgi:hypothetical protein
MHVSASQCHARVRVNDTNTPTCITDAFRRHLKFSYSLNGEHVVTNLAQLRFIRFAKESGVVDWLKDKKNVAKVEKAMRASVTKKGGRKRKKIVCPSISAEDVVLDTE